LARYGVPAELAEARRESLLSPLEPGKAINALGSGRRPHWVNPGRGIDDSWLTIDDGREIGVRWHSWRFGICGDRRNLRFISFLYSRGSRLWRWNGSSPFPVVFANGVTGSYASRQDAKIAEVWGLAGPCPPSGVLSWRSSRLGERTDLGCGRRPRWGVRIFPGWMLISMKHTGVAKRLSI